MVLSVLEMWLHNALEHGWPAVTAAAMCGSLLYQLAQPFLPDFRPSDLVDVATGGGGGASSSGQTTQRSSDTSSGDAAGGTVQKATSVPISRQGSGAVPRRPESSNGNRESDPRALARHKAASKARSSELLRLGMLMAFTMSLHNLPEGFAVGFSALTDFGPIMAMAIAVHNIPEGLIIAAPVYAATGSRWKALGIATLSGLTEPLGATMALIALKPFLTEDHLNYMLAFVGGIMAAVCALELWPEGKKCKEDVRLMAGIIMGGVIMAWTLWVGA